MLATGNTKEIINGVKITDIEPMIQSPLRPDAFDLSDAQKMKRIAGHFREIMEILGLDMTDDSLQDTPKRVAKMYVQEIFSGLNPANSPQITSFENKYQYRNMLIERNIRVQSTCEHHFLPIQGVAHIAYFSSGKVIGLSKLNRIVEFYARRPQLQERLTIQISKALQEILDTQDVAVYIDAKHLCVEARGVEHQGCSTITSDFGGRFLNESVKSEFLNAISRI
ncbi:MAG: GTP cyclohydrolase I FolE [Saprospiraceae bacterium]|nr:GTP cyclohydrolase I FolE [Saprospiraceae bacterium]